MATPQLIFFSSCAITPPTLAEIVRQCRSIRSLCLNHCAEVNDIAVKVRLFFFSFYLSTYCQEVTQRLPGITALGLYACYHLTNATISELQHCRQLTTLSVGHCQYLTELCMCYMYIYIKTFAV